MKKHIFAAALFIGAVLGGSLVQPALSAFWQWSTTAASNATADPSINWSEGMSPSSVNDSARAMMARLADWGRDIGGNIALNGTPTAMTAATNEGFPSQPLEAQMISVFANVTNAVGATVAVDGGIAKPVWTTLGQPIAAGVISSGRQYRMRYTTGGGGGWLLEGFYTQTFTIPDNSIAYAKINKPSSTVRLFGSPSVAAQNITLAANNGAGAVRLTVASSAGYVTGNNKSVSGIVGTVEANGYWTITVVDATHIDLQGSAFVNAYVSGGVIGGFWEEILLGTGLSLNANVLSAPAVPVAAAHKNLSIAVASNTQFNLNSDFITTTNGTLSQTLPHNCTVNMAGTGANGLDTGSIAAATWYSVWAIATPAGGAACLASLQATPNGTFLSTLPSGYTFYARVGWVRTANSVAQLLGTIQKGNRAQYVVGLAQTTQPPFMLTTNNSGAWQALGTGTIVPPTASEIGVTIDFQTNGTSSLMSVAPSANYDTTANSATSGAPPPISAGGNSAVSFGRQSGFILLETTNIFALSSGMTIPRVFAFGWIDNI